MKIKRNNQIRTDLQLTPLIDVVLLLLIFFLLTSSFVTPSAVRVDPPKSETGTAGKRTPTVLTITKKGTILLDGKELPIDELEKKVEGLDEIMIQGDTRANLGTFISVWDILQKQGVKQTYVRVKPKQTNE